MGKVLGIFVQDAAPSSLIAQLPQFDVETRIAMSLGHGLPCERFGVGAADQPLHGGDRVPHRCEDFAVRSRIGVCGSAARCVVRRALSQGVCVGVEPFGRYTSAESRHDRA